MHPLGRRSGIGFANHQGGNHADPHRQRHRPVGPLPGLVIVSPAAAAEPVGEIQRTGAGDQHTDTVTGDISRRHQRLQVDFGRFDTVGINDDILGRRGEAECHGGQRHQRQARLARRRVDRRHAQDRANDRRLRGEQPGTAPAEAAGQQRQRQLIDQRRPDELERVTERGPAKIRHRRALGASLAQPQRQRRKDQQQRHTRRKTQKQHGHHAPVKKQLEGLQPRQRAVGHRVCSSRS